MFSSGRLRRRKKVRHSREGKRHNRKGKRGREREKKKKERKERIGTEKWQSRANIINIKLIRLIQSRVVGRSNHTVSFLAAPQAWFLEISPRNQSHLLLYICFLLSLLFVCCFSRWFSFSCEARFRCIPAATTQLQENKPHGSRRVTRVHTLSVHIDRT